MRTKSKKTPLFTAGERKVAGLAILTAVVVTLSGQVVQAIVPPSLGMYDASPVALVAMPDVIDAQPAA